MKTLAATISGLRFAQWRLFFLGALSACTSFRGAHPSKKFPTPTLESAAPATKAGSTAPGAQSDANVLPAPESPAPAPAGSDLRHQPRSALERAEMERPADAELKLELGRRQWCANARGPAVENWLWVQQFGASRSPVVLQAHSLLASARKDPDALEDRLECGDIRDDERK